MKIRKNCEEPLAYLLTRKEQPVREFVASYLQFAETRDEEALERLATITMSAHAAAKKYGVTGDELAVTNAFTFMTNQLCKQMEEEQTAQAHPVAEPPDAARN
jgi:hypothetical protein